ncbi:MAG TPA: succinate dehydrogenase, cytochrome b556 subunit [Gemmatimonadaceae bacterium]|jgi:succinate dehydrogenase / fumarate reductase cytochrome b subunit|nr:succinate dehydrogenase, cytochrome b556 subunit [Gemmatimonadaceae bacterium]
MRPTTTTNVVRKYSWQFSGMVAHIIQRVTGVLLLIYLFLHVHTIGELSQGQAAFDQALLMFKNPLFRLLEIGLLGLVILHALNGIRLTLIDLGLGHKRQQQLFWALSIGVAGLIFLIAAIPLFIASVLRS